MVGVLVIDMRKLSYPPIWLLFEQGCVQVAAGAPFAVGAGGCCALACGQDPAMSDARPHRRLRLPRLRPWSRPRGFWAVSQEMGADFAMGPGFLCDFWRELFAVSFSDLGKCRRWVAFRADSPCETAQKSQVGLKVAHLDMCSGPVGAGRKHCDCRAVCVDAPSASRGMEGCSGNERSFFARLLRTALRDALISRAISATESPCFLSQRMEYADDMLTIFLPPWSNTCQQ